MWHSRRLFWLVVLLAGALALRVAGGVWWQQRLEQRGTGSFAFADSETYWVLAERLAEGEPFGYGSALVFRTPGYPLLLAPLFLLAEGPPPVLWARVLNAILGTLAVAAVYWLARPLFGSRVAWISAALAAVYPGAIGTSVFVLSEAPFTPLLVLQLGVWVRSWRASGGQRTLWALLAGVLGGAATLVRPSWLLFTPGVALLQVLVHADRRRASLLGLWMLLGLVVVMTPWWIRNYRITGHFVPTTLQVGASLYDGWNPEATGGSDMDFVAAFNQAQTDADRQAQEPLRSTFEYRVDQRMRDAALEWARQHPGQVLQLAAVKLKRMWNVWPNAEELQSWPLRLAILLTYTPLLALALWGLWHFRARGWQLALVALPAVYLTCLHMVFVSSIRYREPAMMALLVPAGAAAVSLWDRLQSRRAATPSSPAGEP